MRSTMLAMLLCISWPVGSAAQDAAPAGIVAAKAAYEEALAGAKSRLVADLDAREKDLHKKPGMTIDQKLEAVKRLRAEKAAFESEGKLPTSREATAAVALYERTEKAARTKCTAVFRSAAEAAAKEGDLDAAERLLVEAKQFFAPEPTAETATPAGSALPAEAVWKPLFNGRSFDGWDGDPELWSLVRGTIVGSTDRKQIKANSCLSTKKSYKNFVLKLDWRLRNGNSGVQLRSKLHDGYRVTGYQADIAEDDFLGILYEEGGRGILAQVADKAAVKAAVKKGDWNTYEITVDGNKIKQVLNGVTTIDFTDKDEKKGAKEGVIALQIHVGEKMQVEFKNILIKELP